MSSHGYHFDVFSGEEKKNGTYWLLKKSQKTGKPRLFCVIPGRQFDKLYPDLGNEGLVDVPQLHSVGGAFYSETGNGKGVLLENLVQYDGIAALRVVDYPFEELTKLFFEPEVICFHLSQSPFKSLPFEKIDRDFTGDQLDFLNVGGLV